MIPARNQWSWPSLTSSWRSLALFALAASTVVSGAGVVAADGGAGESKAEACAACHGEKGVSEIDNTPSLAGQPDLFIQWQLIFFRTGARKNEVMGPIAEQLGNDDIRDLGAYFASLKPPDGTSAPALDDHPELTEVGKKAAAAAPPVTARISQVARRSPELPGKLRSTSRRRSTTISRACGREEG